MSAQISAVDYRPSAWLRATRWVRAHVVAAYGILALIYLFTPIALIIAFSFNKPVGRQNSTWNEFSLDAWLNISRDPTIVKALSTSLRIAFVSTHGQPFFRNCRGLKSLGARRSSLCLHS